MKRKLRSILWLAAAIVLAPVSYTHLDVYKRQRARPRATPPGQAILPCSFMTVPRMVCAVAVDLLPQGGVFRLKRAALGLSRFGRGFRLDVFIGEVDRRQRQRARRRKRGRAAALDDCLLRQFGDLDVYKRQVQVAFSVDNLQLD